MKCCLDLCVCFLALTFSFLWFACFLFNRSSQPPHKNQIPQSHPFLGNIIGLIRNRHRFHDWVADMLAASPSSTIQVNGFLGLSRGICTADPAHLHHILVAASSNFVKGDRFRSVLSELLGDGIFNVDGELWFTQRKIASHEFNTKSLKHFISQTVQAQLSKTLIPYLASACDAQEVIDLQDVLRRFAFDNVCRVAFGVDPSRLDLQKGQNLSSESFVNAFDYCVEHCSGRFMLPLPLVWKIKRLLNIGDEKQYRQAIESINAYVSSIISLKEQNCENGHEKGEEPAQAPPPPQDLLSRFMNSSSNLKFRDEDEKRTFLRDIVLSFILAGKDSTSTALTWFFWLIAGHPRCEGLILDELSAASSENPPGNGIFSYDKMKEFNYLHAALTESLRLYPPVPINSRLTMADDRFSAGTFVGKGWFADYSAYAMGRMERLWGSDCREFRPERWLDGNGGFQPCDQFKFPVFHCGPRTCLGKDMAYVQMKSIAAAVLHEFRVMGVDGGGFGERMLNPPYTLSLVLKMKGGFSVRLKRR